MWRDIASRSLWLSAGSAIGRLLPFIVLIILGRSLSSAQFASVSIGFAWTAVAASLTTAGLANVTAQRMAVLHPDMHTSFIGRVSKLGGLLSMSLLLAGALAGPGFVHFAFGDTVDQRIILPSLIGGCAWSLVMLCVAICNGRHKPRSAAAVLGVGGALQGAGLAAGHAIGGGAPSVMWGAALGNGLALSWALLCANERPKQTKSPSSGTASLPDMRFGRSVAWSSVAAASVMPITFVAGSLVSHGPDGVGQLAQFQALEQMHLLAIYLPGVLGQALLPVLAVHIHIRAVETMRKVVWTSLILAVGGTLIAMAASPRIDWLHRIIGNPALVDADATRAMLLNAGLSVSLSLLGAALLARAHYARATLLNLGWASVFLGMGWLWQIHGAAGVQAARLCASWLLVLFASAMLWFDVERQPKDSTLAGRLTSQKP